jgi:hypothetical protein
LRLGSSGYALKLQSALVAKPAEETADHLDEPLVLDQKSFERQKVR